MASQLICSIHECGKKVVARGYCKNHYERWRKHGSPHVKLKRHGELLAWLKGHVSFTGDGCLWWPFGKNSRGYGEVVFEGRTQLASRVMCILVHGEPPEDGMQAAHSCGKGMDGCVHPQHLRWATPAENEGDKRGHGTDSRGARNAAAKLTEADVLEIRRLANLPYANQRILAEQFDITQQTVSDIKVGRRWGWL